MPFNRESVILALGFQDVGTPYPDIRKMELPRHFQFVSVVMKKILILRL